jgi:SdrD B-like domain/LysM domain
MKTKLLALCLLLAGLFLLWMQVPAAASPNPQTQYATPTALPDGRIIYIVQAGDNCTRISLLTGVSVDYLRVTNQLNENCDLREGQQLLIGVGGPSVISPTPGPSPTPTPILPTPTPGVGGTAEVCVLMYVDSNGDGLRQETEFGVDNGAISLVSANGQYSQMLNTTSALDSVTQDAQRACFTDLQPGAYTVSAGVPAGYNATTALNTVVNVGAGDTTYVDFGVQVQAVAEDTGRNSPSPLLGIVGIALLLTGIGLGIYFWRILRKK